MQILYIIVLLYFSTGLIKNIIDIYKLLHKDKKIKKKLQE